MSDEELVRKAVSAAFASLERRSWLFSPSFIKRAFAVFGHMLFVQLVLGFGWLLLLVLFGGL